MLRRPKNNHKNIFLLLTIAILLIAGTILVGRQQVQKSSRYVLQKKSSGEIISGKFNPDNQRTDEEWKKILTQEQYHILRDAGTEIPFTGELNNEKRQGTYYSVGCNKPLFRSEQKFDSGTGWPSFWAPIDENAVVLRKETGLGDDRIEVLDTCGGHLGHVFDDGPEPTGKRYCMNSSALLFKEDTH